MRRRAGAKGGVETLLSRCHELGSHPRYADCAAGSASFKRVEVDAVTRQRRAVMYLKGSEVDFGTFTRDRLAVFDVARLRALKEVYPGQEHEYEMVALLDQCLVGRNSATPSIDTAMHALLDCAHVDHLHPHSVIALAAAVDGESLTKECFGGEIGWVPWHRPGFELALEIETLQREQPHLRGVVLESHGLTAWADTSDECQRRSLEIIEQAEVFLRERGKVQPFGPIRPGYGPLEPAQREARAAAVGPLLRGLSSAHGRVVGQFHDDPELLELLASESAERLVPLGTPCPDHSARTNLRPLLLDLPGTAHLADVEARLPDLYAQYRQANAAYYTRHAVADTPPIRMTEPAIVLLPGIGMWSFGADAQSAREAGQLYLNVVRVMRGAEALSTYAPIPETESFRIEYGAYEQTSLNRRPQSKALTGRVALVTGGGSGIGRAIAIRFAAEGAAVVVTDCDSDAARTVAEDIGGPDTARAIHLDVTAESSVQTAFAETCLAYGGVDLVVNNAGLSMSRSLLETTAADWDTQHDVMARGAFLVSREAARVMIDQGVAADILYVVSKNAVVAGPQNIAYSATKADQAHQVRLLAAELGEHGIRVNGINPDGVVRGSGIFSNGWGDQRAALYGVPVDDLGKYYAGRTLLKQEVLPEHIAAAAFALVGGDLSLTTGTHVPVDGGVPAAFPR